MHISPAGIFPKRPLSPHESLEEQKRRLAAAVAASFTARQIRAHGLANLHRWREAGVWVAAYDEWQRILEKAPDGALFAAMLGRDERANRLRESPPYVGMLPKDEVRLIGEEVMR